MPSLLISSSLCYFWCVCHLSQPAITCSLFPEGNIFHQCQQSASNMTTRPHKAETKTRLNVDARTWKLYILRHTHRNAGGRWDRLRLKWVAFDVLLIKIVSILRNMWFWLIHIYIERDLWQVRVDAGFTKQMTSVRFSSKCTGSSKLKLRKTLTYV